MTDPAAILASVAASSREVAHDELPHIGPRSGADSGDPQVAARVLARDAASGTEVGVWSCTPGGWPVDSRTDTEVAHILSGRAVITDEGGARRELGAGDAIILPVGWTGRWDVVEDVRKLYVLIRPITG
jgi:uncharacterized protein